MKSIRHEDGTLDLYDYELASNLWTRTITHLHEQSPSPVSGKTTRDITTTNSRGEILEEKTEAYIGEVWYTIARNQMTYNSTGKRITSENLAGQVATTAWNQFACTSVDELISAAKNAKSAKHAYDFDDIGNRETSSERGTNSVYTANQLNQYAEISDSALSASPRETFTPQFDDDGNQTLIKTATGIWSVTYNGENRPILWECVTPDPNTSNSNTQTLISMSYDRMGRRVEYLETTATGNSTITTNAHHRFVYNGYLCVQRLDAANDNAADLLVVWDPTEPVATRPLFMLNPGGHAFFCTHDGNKNVSEVFFVQQAYGIAAHYECAPFGAVTAATRNTSVTSVDVRTFNPFCFSSEYADDTLGLVYYNYRHYSPCDGRWMGRDSIRELFGLIRFDTDFFEGEYRQHQYYFIDGHESIWADNEVNYIGIGMYEAWIGHSLNRAAVTTALWKLRYLDIPSDGTCYWLAYGHTMFETYYDKLDPCTCEFKDGKEVDVENYNRRRRSGK